MRSLALVFVEVVLVGVFAVDDLVGFLSAVSRFS